MDNNSVNAGFVIRNLVNFCRWGEEGLKEAPLSIKEVIEKQLYREFILYGTETVVQFETFPKFCEASVEDGGLGATKEILMNLCKGENAIQRLISVAYAPPKIVGGRPRKKPPEETPAAMVMEAVGPEPLQESPEERLEKILEEGVKDTSDPLEETPQPKPRKKVANKTSATKGRLSDNVRKSPSAKQGGNNTEYRLERLSTEAPEEYDKVMKKEKSVNAACIDAGLAKKKIQVNKDDPKQAAKILFKHYGKEGVKELIKELQELL